MADQFQSVQDILTSDGILTAILTGGVFDDEDTGAHGLTPQKADSLGALDANKLLELCAVIAWDTATPAEINLAEVRTENRFFFVYIYGPSHAGYTNIETARNRIKVLLNQVQRTVDSQYTHVSRWVDDGARFRADELFDACGVYSRFVDTYGR